MEIPNRFIFKNLIAALSKCQGHKIKYFPLCGVKILLSFSGEIWSSHRKFLTPTFHFKILENSLEIIHKNAGIFVEQIKPKVGKSEFDIQIFVEKMSLDVISGK